MSKFLASMDKFKRKFQLLKKQKQSQPTPPTSDSENDIETENPMTAQVFAKLTGLSIIETDQEDDLLKEQEYMKWQSLQISTSMNSELETTSQHSILSNLSNSTAHSKPRKISQDFFTPLSAIPMDNSSHSYSHFCPSPGSHVTGITTLVDGEEEDSNDMCCDPIIPSEYQTLMTLPCRQHRRHSSFHLRSRSDTSSTSPVQVSIRGRFTITRETIESTQWRPRSKTTTTSSRFKTLPSSPV